MTEFYETKKIPIISSSNLIKLRKQLGDLEFYACVDDISFGARMEERKMILGIITNIPIKNKLTIKTQIQNKNMILVFRKVVGYDISKELIPGITKRSKQVLNVICHQPRTMGLTEKAKELGLDERYNMTNLVYDD
jgi:hypothetical protein